MTPEPSKRRRRPKPPSVLEEDLVRDDTPIARSTARASNGAPEQDENMRPGTSFNDSAAYQASLMAAAAAAAPAAPSNRPPVPPFPVAAREENEYRPSTLSVFIHTLPRYVSRLFKDTDTGFKAYFKLFLLLLAALLFMWVSTAACFAVGAHVPLPSKMEPYRQRMLYRTATIMGIPGYDKAPEELELRWHQFTHDRLFSGILPNRTIPHIQYVINANLLKRIEAGENVTREIAKDIAVQSAAVAELNRILPQTIVATNENGQWEVPSHFWGALVQKMQSDDAAPLWDKFMANNEEKLHALTRRVLEGEMDDAATSHRLITKDEFQTTLSENNARQQQDMMEILRRFKTETKSEIRAMVHEEIERSEMGALARSKLSTTGKTNMMYNAERALHETNYFSIGLGAFTNPYLTSPTRMPNTDTWGRKVFSIFFGGWGTRAPHPPSTALTSWEEATDCWCAAPSNKHVKAQLAVYLKHKIYPESFTIEHIPATGTRDIAAAPRNIELWVQVANATEAARITEAIRDTVFYRYEDACAGGPPPSRQRNWVCLAADTYDIHSPNFVQPNTIHPDTRALDIATDHVVVRVTDNWGSTHHTCLYRVRLAGTEVGTPVE